MNFLAKDNNIEIKNNLPKISEIELNRFNKSRLVIKDQWHHIQAPKIELLCWKTQVYLIQISIMNPNQLFFRH